MQRTNLPDPGLSFPEAFAERVRREPDTRALSEVRFHQREPIAWPYSCEQLFHAAQHAGLLLARAGLLPGDRVVLSLSDAAQFFSFLLGAQCIGAIPVPVPGFFELPTRGYINRIISVVSDAEPRVLIVDDAAARRAVHEELGASVHVAEARSLAAPELASELVRFEPRRAPDEIAFLQYTSGSTGSPKGVVVLHRNLVANLRAIMEGAAVGDDDVVYSWLPLFHDMGLVAGLLLGLYAGIPAYVAPPKTFIARPDSWLRGVSKFRATFSPGPNFAFDSLARKIPDRLLVGVDLSSWRLAFDGAEPVHPETARAFTSRYAPYGFRESSFRPAYGLAECTLAAAFPRPGIPTHFDCVDRAALCGRGVAVPVCKTTRNAVVHTSVGVPVPMHRIRVLEVDGSREMPSRHLGEVVIEGPSVTPGYFRELTSGATARSVLRTGDLGYIADGELYLVDRLKDVILIAGKKYAPADIEQVVASVDGIRNNSVIAFGARGRDGTESAYVAASVRPGAPQRKPFVAAAICRAILDQFGLALADVFLVRPGILPKTSSGKVMRSACVALLEAGVFASECRVTRDEMPRSLQSASD